MAFNTNTLQTTAERTAAAQRLKAEAERVAAQAAAVQSADAVRKAAQAQADVLLRARLDIIDGWLAGKGGRELWQVLSATRGEDGGTNQSKLESTCVVRAVAFPKTAEATRKGEIHIGAGFAVMPQAYSTSRVANEHCRTHLNDAARILKILS